jgi:hypothetical protein
MSVACSSSQCRRTRALVLALLLGVMFFVVGGNSEPTAPILQPQTVAAEPDPLDEDARFRALAVGTWEDDYKGHRTMRLEADGTGSMVVELSGLTARLFAARLEFDMVWSVTDGRMQKQTLGGRPTAKVKAILKMMGDRVDEPIQELTDNRLLLLDKDGRTQYDWRRVTETATLANEPPED